MSIVACYARLLLHRASRKLICFRCVPCPNCEAMKIICILISAAITMPHGGFTRLSWNLGFMLHLQLLLAHRLLSEFVKAIAVHLGVCHLVRSPQLVLLQPVAAPQCHRPLHRFQQRPLLPLAHLHRLNLTSGARLPIAMRCTTLRNALLNTAYLSPTLCHVPLGVSASNFLKSHRVLT